MTHMFSERRDLESELRDAISRIVEMRVEVGLLIQEVNKLRSDLAAEIAECNEQADIISRLREELSERDVRIAALGGV